MEQFNVDSLKSVDWTMPILTFIGALGMGISLKGKNAKFMNNPIFQLITLTILVYQGGGSQNLMVSGIVAFLGWIVIHFFNFSQGDHKKSKTQKFMDYLKTGGYVPEKK